MLRFDYESPETNEGARSTGLSVTLGQLKVIRNHRLMMATHSWQRQCRVLGELLRRSEQLKHEIQVKRMSYAVAGKTQLERFSVQRIPLSEINTWLDKERNALSEIQRFQKKVDALKEEIQLQRQWIDESYKKMISLQRQVEKLNFLSELT